MIMMTTTSFTQMTTEIVFHTTTHQVHGCFHYQEYGSKPTPWLLCEVWWKQMSQLLLSHQRWWNYLSKKVATNHDPILSSHAFNDKNCQISETTLERFLGDSSQSPVSIEDMGETPVVRFLYNLPFMIFVFKLGLKRSFGSRFVMLVRHHHQWGEVSEETRKKWQKPEKHPGKFNVLKLKNWALEDNVPFQFNFLVPCLVFGAVGWGLLFWTSSKDR